MTPKEHLFQALEGQSGPLGIAVSGGSDSTALLHLAADWAKEQGCLLHAATVNHGLRDEAAAECAMVAAQCAALGVSHQTLHWTWNGAGNLQAEARAGRYDALAEWACSVKLTAVALGHTQDDVAETFLMRLARGSGVTGLAQMQPAWCEQEMNWLRPLLGCSRVALREVLEPRGVLWSEDKSNSDRRFDRVKTRAALDALAPLGITRVTLAETAARLGSARAALDRLVQELAQKAVHLNGPDLIVSSEPLMNASEETQQRLFGQAVAWIGQSAYPPRRQATLSALEAACDGQKKTLNGCLIVPEAGQIRIARELVAVEAVRCASHEVWDGRFALHGPHQAGYTIAALSEAGLALCETWRETGLPRASLLASPAVWDKSKLVAAPLAGFDEGWRVEIVRKDAFFCQ